MPTTEYMSSLLEAAKKYLPGWLMKELHKLALPSSGGKARWREPEEPSFLEKMALSDIRPEKLKDAPDDEVRLAWLRVSQWFGAARKRGDPVEGIVNATTWLMDEFDRRGWTYEDSDLVQEAKKLQGVKKAQSIEAKLAKLPAEIMIVPDFVSLVGSSVSSEAPNDLDVLLRADKNSQDDFIVRAENIELGIRNAVREAKLGLTLHYIANAQGARDNYRPLFHLVLRQSREGTRVIKDSNDQIDQAIQVILDYLDNLGDGDGAI